jgi:PAS domain S-box-containing protein
MAQTDQSHFYKSKSSEDVTAPDPHQHSAVRIAGTFLVAGFLWIGLSDVTLAWFGGLTATGLLVAVGKGLVFVFLSTLLIYELCRREYRNSARTMRLLRAVVDGTTDAVFVKDCQGRYQLVNNAAAEFIGRPVAEVIGQDDSDLFGPVEAERLMANDQAIMESGRPTTQDETLTSHGVTRVYQATKAPYFDASGKVVGLIGISRNITDRAQVESVLRETDARFREAQRIAKLGSWSWNPQTDHVWWSDAEFEIFGLAPHAIRPSFDAFLNFLHPDDHQVAIARVQAIQGGTDEIANDLRIIRGDGTCIWIHSRAHVTRDASGEVVRVEGTDQDITAQRITREILYESEGRLQAAVEVAGLGVIDIDYDRQLVELSPRAAEQFAFPIGLTISRADLHSRIYPSDQKELATAIDEALSPEGSGGFAMEHRVIRPDGSVRWLNIRKQVFFADGHPKRAIVVTADVTDQREARSRLREQEMLVREAAELAKVGGWGFDPVTLQSDWTPTVAEIYGVDHDSPPTLTKSLEFFRSNHRTELEKAFIEAREKGLPYDMELQLVAATGENKWVRAICRPIVENGRVVRVRGSLQDITDRKLADEAREVATQRLSKFASQLPGAIYLYRLGPDNKSCVPYASDKIESILGIPQDLINDNEIDAFAKVHAEDYNGVLESIQKSAKNLSPFSREFRVVGDDGATRWISCDAVPEREPDGSTLWHGYMKEVTEAHQAAIQLEDAKIRLEEAQALARIGSWSYDVTTDTHHWSKQMYKIFGFESSAAPPDYQKMLNTLDRTDAVKLDEAVKAARINGTPYSLDVRIQQTNSGVRYVRCEGRSRCDSGGKIVGLFGTSADVTAEVEREQALKIARNQADAANRTKSEFLANMSHEIRTPLTAILGFAEVLREDVNFAAPPHWIHDLDTIASAGKHLLSIINDILDLSKIEADKTTLELIETPLIEVLSDVERLLQTTASGKGVKLSTKISSPIPDRILCDPTRLRQILMNLVGNAVKFTEAGTIVISVGHSQATDNASLIIDIEDTGRGINQEQSQALFQAFEQADNTVSRKHGGTGLGLTISRRLAVLMGGDVTLERTQLGKGSCFRLVLPLVPVAGSVLIKSIEERQISTTKVSPEKVFVQGRILLAEDGPDNQRLIAFLLKKAGATVDVADDGKIALAMIDKANESGTPYDLLITDMQMPVMDGYMLAKTLRSRGDRIPIVALTAHAQAEDRQKCVDAGCDDYLSKPIDKHSLLSFCAKWISGPQ